MPSQKRGGLSKREVKRAQAAKAVTAPKLTARQPSAPKLTNTVPANFIGPTLNTQSRGSVVPDNFIGPLRPGIDMRQSEVKPKQSSPVERRKEAAKANIKKSGIDVQSAIESGGLKVNQMSLPISQRPASYSQGSSSLFGDLQNKGMGFLYSLFNGQGEMARLQSQRGTPELSPDERAKNLADLRDSTFGIPRANAAGPLMTQNTYESDLQSAFGDGNQPVTIDDFRDDGLLFSDGRTGEQTSVLSGLNARERNYKPKGDSKLDVSMDDEVSPISATIDPPFRDTQYDGAPLTDTPGATTGNRSGRGSGMFGTGKGTQGNPLLDEYQSQLKGFRKQGNKMEDLYDEMLKSLDPTYDSYSADIKKSVDEELRQNLLQLASVMNANNTGDSEQRMQLMSQQQGQSQANLGDLLRKLMLQKQQDEQGIKEKKVNSLSQLQDRQMTTREKMASLMAEASKEGRSGSGANSGQKTLEALLKRAANMQSGGREYAQKQAKMLGLGDIGGYTPDNWEQAWNPKFGKTDRLTGGDTIQELADALGVDYSTAQKMYLAEQGY